MKTLIFYIVKLHSREEIWVPVLRIAILTLLVIFLYYRVMWDMVLYWWTHSEYSHAFLIPLISGFLLWHQRDLLRRCPKVPSLEGGIIFVVGLGIYLLGMSGEEEIIQRLSFPITLMGLIYFLNGKRLARICLFSIGYLFLMIPIPYTLYKTLALKLRLLDAQLAASWSSFLGIPIFREADLLYLPQITLEVADGCSGVLSIVALLSLGIFYIYQLRIKPWGKALLLALLIPVAVLANVIRIVTIVVLVHNSGTWVLNTVIHKFNGVFNFILGFMTIVMVGAVMNKISLRRKTV